MNRPKLLIAAMTLVFCVAAQAQTAPTKVGVIHIENALLGTQEGQKAAQDLQTKFDPTSKRLQGMRDEINALQAELSKGSNTMGEERRRELARDIDEKTRDYNRSAEDAQADFQAEQNRILQDLGQKMMAVVQKYSRDNGYAIVFDISNPQTPVVHVANGIEITQDIIKLYDEEAAKAAEMTSATPQASATP